MHPRYLGQGAHPLRDPADPEEWGDSLPTWQDQARERAQQARDKLPNEVRWGAQERFRVDIPATSVVPVVADLKQIIDVRAPARGWTLAFSFTWNDVAQANPLDVLHADFIYEIGVGSARAVFFQGIDMPQTSPVNILSTIVGTFPAATIVVSGRITITPVSGLARAYNATLGVLSAPVVR